MSAMLERLREVFAAHTPALPGGERLVERRRRALQDFLERGVPTTREEDWKYTSLTRLEELDLVPAELPDASRVEAALARYAIEGLDAHRLVFVNGRQWPGGSSANSSAVWLQPLATALVESSAEERLGSVVDLERYRFALLNEALFSDGTYIRIPRSRTGPLRPVYLLFLNLGGERASMVTPRVFIETEEGGEAVVIEHFAGDGGKTVTNHVTEVVARSGSRVAHYRVQEQAADHLHIAGLNLRLERDTRVACHNIDFGGELVRNDVHARLEGPGAEIVLNGLYYTAGTQHVDNHTRVDHISPRTCSRESYRGVLQGTSRAVFNGKVVVARNAQKIEAHQSNDNLLLSRRCEVDTKPELEIYADDVVCTHGATVGQLDETALFYLRSRGIGEATARSLLTFAFANEVVSRIELPELRARLTRRVLGRLPEHERLEAGLT